MKSPSPFAMSGGIRSSLRHAYWFGVAGLAIIALSVIGIHAFERRVVTAMLESRDAMRLAREARSLSLDEETGIRGYLLIRRPLALGPALAARTALAPKVDSLVRQSRRSTAQSDRALNIRNSIDRWHRGYVFPTLAHADSGGSPGTQGDVAGKELFDGIRSAFSSYLGMQERRYNALVRFDLLVRRAGLAIILLEIALVVGMMTAMSRRSADQARRLLEQQEMLEEQATELEHQAEQLEGQAAELEEQSEARQETLTKLAGANRDLEATVAELRAAQASATEASAERELVQSLLDTVLASAPMGFGIFDAQFRYIFANEAMGRMNAMPADRLIGKAPRDIGTPDLASQVEAMLKRVLETREPVRDVPVSGSFIEEPDKERHWLVNYFWIGDDSEESEHGVGIIATEITERKRLEEQLIQAQKLEAAGRLAGGVAHDFNNLLTAIKSYSELLLADLDPRTPQHVDAGEINKAADRATALTRQLLAFSRQQVMRPRLMNLNSTIEEIRGILRPLVGKGIQIDTILDSGLASVTADPAEIERVIVNLAVNARDAMPQGGKLTFETANVFLDHTYVSEHPETSPGPYVMLAITDTGQGMSREVRERLFEPFFTTKPRGKGTGLGLSSAYGIVRQSNGHIWVYSEPGRGTTFKIYLPRAEAVALDVADKVRRRSKGAESILLVEDDEAVRVVAARILRGQQYAVREAASGTEALAICTENGNDFDLVITDIVMPGMDGAELASRLMVLRPDTRILFTSGYTEDSAIRQRILHPGASFLEKPFTVDALARKTREILDAGGDGLSA